ncbi:unnamed protein product [Nezara viridula]|uniref:Carboxypeptidase Q n=1 Tax=Nezara viridula TaxID=85310 RepID=A0A9P0MLR4_NEZVI|nr:unnamed protein product [Nezara viridula]
MTQETPYFLILSIIFLNTVFATSNYVLDESCGLPNDLKAEIQSYQPIVNKIIKSAVSGPHKSKTYKELADFVDKFGYRISGSENLEHAIDYMLNKSISYKLDNVHGEPVMIPHWVRGHEEATLLSPRETNLSILGLGGSIATPPEGITASVLVVESFDELKNKSNEAKGKIVVFVEEWVNYGVTVKYRDYAAVEGAKVGAVATLIRSVTPFSINSPHTGWQDYSDDVPKIPTAALTVEDAYMLLRMYRRGDKIIIRLKMEAKNMPPVQSRNTISEIEGKQIKDKAVIVSGHLDSWDVGNGAMDDGGGAFISWYSLVLLKSLNIRPRRTIRTILWTGEEPGLVGAVKYSKVHNKDEFVLLMESDEGTFTPEGITFSGTKQANCIMKEILSLLSPINATKLELSNDVGSDISIWSNQGIPMASLLNKNERYFWYHHSNGDTMTVENSDDLDKCLAVWASVAYVVADLSVNLSRL